MGQCFVELSDSPHITVRSKKGTRIIVSRHGRGTINDVRPVPVSALSGKKCPFHVCFSLPPEALKRNFLPGYQVKYILIIAIRNYNLAASP